MLQGMTVRMDPVKGGGRAKTFRLLLQDERLKA